MRSPDAPQVWRLLCDPGGRKTYPTVGRPTSLVTLNQLTPAKYGSSELRGYFWNSIGAILVMLVFENMPITETVRYPFCLGNISFSFYIVHLLSCDQSVAI